MLDFILQPTNFFSSSSFIPLLLFSKFPFPSLSKYPTVICLPTQCTLHCAVQYIVYTLASVIEDPDCDRISL